MTHKSWHRTGTAPHHGLRFEDQAAQELGREETSTFAFQQLQAPPEQDPELDPQWRPLHQSTRAAKAAPQVSAIASFIGELMYLDAHVGGQELETIETLVAMCSVMCEALPQEQTLEIELRHGAKTACAIALDRQFIFVDFILQADQRRTFKARAEQSRAHLSPL
jgi:hypothetical protein